MLGPCRVSIMGPDRHHGSWATPDTKREIAMMRPRLARLILSLAGPLALLFTACGQDNPTAVTPHLTDADAGDFTDPTKSVADILYGKIKIGSLDSDDEVTVARDTIFKDTVAIGYLVAVDDTASTYILARNDNPFGVPPGECWVEIDIVWYPGSGLIRSIKITVLYCVAEESDEPGGGSTADTVAVKLACPDQPERGESVECTFSVSPSSLAVTNIEWKFVGLQYVSEKTKRGGMSWGGVAVETGTMTVSADVGGVRRTAEQNIFVLNRGWRWDADTAWDDNADPCRAWGSSWGRVAPSPCGTTFFNVGDESHVVGAGDGPWAGVYYVDSPNADVVARAMYRPSLTENGTEYSIAGVSELVAACGSNVSAANEYTANLVCLDVEGYKSLRTHIHTHETGHLNDISSVVAGHNIYLHWDGLISTSADEVEKTAKKLAEDAHADLLRRAAARDAAETYPGWRFWLYTGSWDWDVHITPW